MLDHEYETMRQVEDAYWWYQVLRTVTVREVAACAGGRTGLSLLDAGCGTGGTMDALRQMPGAPVLHGIDISPLAVDFTRSRGFEKVAAGSIDGLPFADHAFDIVVSLDVLYHEGLDEQRAVSEFFRVLKPGGFLILNLPAFDLLSGSHDIAVGGVRRYTSPRVSEMMERSGFQMTRIQYWNAWLFLPILLWRQLSRRWVGRGDQEAKSDLKPMQPRLAQILTKMGLFDFKACRALRIPFGTSVFSVAQKPSPR